jgi:outer membrane protein assembly factor BamD (BamD/ComL family)
MRFSFRKSLRNKAYVYVLAVMLLASCTTINEESRQTMPHETAPSNRIKENKIRTAEEKKSFDIFNEIFSISNSSRDRQTVLPKIEALYMQIISDYPETPLAQESHWRLIHIYVRDYAPPDYGRAEMLYHDFLTKYPDSPLKGVVADTLGRSYVKHGEWSRLLTLCSPSYRRYVEKKITPRASLMFMYAEAHYHLGNMEQAENAYSLVSGLFPDLMVGKKSKSMIEKIANPGN